MSKKRLFWIIFPVACFVLTVILIFESNGMYNNYVVDSNKWNEIIGSRNMSESIKLQNIIFNDYNLFVSDDNVIYYSLTPLSSKYNPSVRYYANDKVKIALSKKMDEWTDGLKIMIYNDKLYRIYDLVVTELPILSVSYGNNTEFELFDNHVNSPQRIIKSQGRIKKVGNNEYVFSLFKRSIGKNKRDNYISLFGMEKRNEYVIKYADRIDKNEMYVQFFINNKYMGIYSIGHREWRVNNFERNKENNK